MYLLQRHEREVRRIRVAQLGDGVRACRRRRLRRRRSSCLGGGAGARRGGVARCQSAREGAGGKDSSGTHCTHRDGGGTHRARGARRAKPGHVEEVETPHTRLAAPRAAAVVNIVVVVVVAARQGRRHGAVRTRPPQQQP